MYEGESVASLSTDQFARALADLRAAVGDDGAPAHRNAEEEPPGNVEKLTARVMSLQQTEPASAGWKPFVDWVQATWPVSQPPADPAAMTVALRGLVSAAERITQIPTHAERDELARVTDALVSAIAHLQKSPTML